MPPNLRPRYSPSGAFMPGSGELEGFVRRVWHYYNENAVAVDEGDTATTVVEVPFTLAASDQPIAELSWLAIGQFQARVPIPGGEEPIAFPWAATLGCMTSVPATPLVLPHIGWPTSPDDYNGYNLLTATFAFAQPNFLFQVGANSIRLGMSFYNTGGAHTAWVDIGQARLTVVEFQGPPVAYGTF